MSREFYKTKFENARSYNLEETIRNTQADIKSLFFSRIDKYVRATESFIEDNVRLDIIVADIMRKLLITRKQLEQCNEAADEVLAQRRLNEGQEKSDD